MARFPPFQPNLIRHCAVVIPRPRPSSLRNFHRRMRTEPCGADTARGGHNMTHCHCSARSVLLEQLRNPSILEISQVIFSSSRCNALISSSARRCKDPRGSHLRGFSQIWPRCMQMHGLKKFRGNVLKCDRTMPTLAYSYLEFQVFSHTIKVVIE